MALLIASAIFLLNACAVAKDVTVETDLGDITGEVEELTFDGKSLNVTKFLGIPFAEPPIGSRRFAKPIRKSSLIGNFVAKTMTSTCIQNSAFLSGSGTDPKTLNQSEDCLYLNVFIPGTGPVDKTKKYAVMIWIYGGDFQVGYQHTYNAKTLVGLNDVILVTLNYRVSFLGFLSTSEDNRSGNYGLWDQHMAIQWVHDHITNFGGDPKRVTLFGESAGAASVVYQALFEGNDGLFQRVIAQSGSANTAWASEKNPGSVYMNFANKTGCINESQIEIINCFRKMNVTEIMDNVGYSDSFRPVKDGHFVKIHLVELFRNTSAEAWNILSLFGKLDFIFGVTSSEGSVYLGYLDKLTTTNSGIKPSGYSRETFENSIVPFAIKQGKLKDSTALKTAIIHQYSDWTDPTNEVQILKKTVDLFSDWSFNADIVQSAMAHSETAGDGRLYLYVFDQKGALSDARMNGANHGEELAFVLGFPARLEALYHRFGITIPPVYYALSRKLMEYWTNFAKTGDPNIGESPSTLTTWPEYDTDTQKYIRFRADLEPFPVEDHFAAARVNFWQNLVPVISEECDKICPTCSSKVSSATSTKMALLLTAFLLIILWL